MRQSTNEKWVDLKTDQLKQEREPWQAMSKEIKYLI